MALYSYLIGLTFAYISYTVYQKYMNVYSSIILKPEKKYDYIIVGAGTAGCVLASRLSEDPKTKVLLVEAGDHMGYFTRIPLMATAAQQGPNDWSVKTSAQKFSSFGLWEQLQFIPRGKGLGGSGQINFLLHGFGFPEDYKRWSDLGFKGWTLEDLKPYFIKAFGTDTNEFDSGHCAVEGNCPGSEAPMILKLIDEQNELMTTFREASNRMRNEHTIFRRATATVTDGKRHTAFDAYLKPALARTNLHVLLKTQAISVRFVDKIASSLFILQNHRELNNIFVNKEIILSAGAIRTPQLLMLSGIGPKDSLQKLQIKLISDNDHVGMNLHDHMNMPIYISVKKPITLTLAKVFSFRTVWDYYWNAGGLMAFPPVAGVEYQNTSAVMIFSMGTASERLLRDLSNYKPEVFRDTFPFYNDTKKEGFIFLATCVQPTSRGTITLVGTSTKTPPVVDPKYLEQSTDVDCMIKAIRRAEMLVSSKPFQDIGARIHWPRPERCLSFWKYSGVEQRGLLQRKRLIKNRTKAKATKYKTPKSPPDVYLECVLREIAVTGHHAGGTCSGGTVVDDKLRVKSISGLRIIDASVLPSPISLYPNSVLVAMAEKAAEMMRNDL